MFVQHCNVVVCNFFKLIKLEFFVINTRMSGRRKRQTAPEQDEDVTPEFDRPLPPMQRVVRLPPSLPAEPSREIDRAWPSLSVLISQVLGRPPINTHDFSLLGHNANNRGSTALHAASEKILELQSSVFGLWVAKNLPREPTAASDDREREQVCRFLMVEAQRRKQLWLEGQASGNYEEIPTGPPFGRLESHDIFTPCAPLQTVPPVAEDGMKFFPSTTEKKTHPHWFFSKKQVSRSNCEHLHQPPITPTTSSGMQSRPSDSPSAGPTPISWCQQPSSTLTKIRSESTLWYTVSPTCPRAAAAN